MHSEEASVQATTESTQDKEIKELLEEDVELAKENNKILKRMERNALIGFIAKLVIWLIVLGVPLFFLAPYIKPLFTLMTTGETPEGTDAQSLFGLPSAEQLQELIDIYGGGQ